MLPPLTSIQVDTQHVVEAGSHATQSWTRLLCVCRAAALVPACKHGIQPIAWADLERGDTSETREIAPKRLKSPVALVGVLKIGEPARLEQCRRREKDEHATVAAPGESDRLVKLSPMAVVGEDHRPDRPGQSGKAGACGFEQWIARDMLNICRRGFEIRPDRPLKGILVCESASGVT